jgi:hypothetical protein
MKALDEEAINPSLQPSPGGYLQKGKGVEGYGTDYNAI